MQSSRPRSRGRRTFLKLILSGIGFYLRFKKRAPSTW
jgi:hypothetical protein